MFVFLFPCFWIIIKVTDIIYDSTNTTITLNDTYKVVVRTVDTTTNTNCINYYAQRTIVTVPVSILRGNGYSINFQPTINLENLPYWTGQFTKVFFKFNTNFWSTTDHEHEFIAILRNSTYRYVCNHWMNLNIPIPESNTLLCIISSVGMKKYISMNLTEIDLLEPLKVVYGTDIVTNAYESVISSRWDLDPASGYGAYSNYRSGYTYDQAKLFWGGYDGSNNDALIKGEGHNNLNEWIVHLTGAASCEVYNEQTDGAYFAGKRSARHVLRSIYGNDDIELLYDCDDGESSE
jgi:Flavin containing amine oxidoreductase